MKRTRFYNTSTGKWEYWTLCRGAWRPLHDASVLLRLLLRRMRGRLAGRRGPAVYGFDPDKLQMLDPKTERRQRRRNRCDRFFAQVSNALNTMIEMQKFIK